MSFNFIKIKKNDAFFLSAGDSGYVQSQIMLTPYRKAQPNTPQWRYTKEIQATRCSNETTFGELSSQFRMINRSRGLRYHPHKAAQLVVGSVVLHDFKKLNR